MKKYFVVLLVFTSIIHSCKSKINDSSNGLPPKAGYSKGINDRVYNYIIVNNKVYDIYKNKSISDITWKNNSISIIFYDKNERFGDETDLRLNKLNQIEKEINDNKSKISEFWFETVSNVSFSNNVKYLDTLVFSEFHIYDRQLTRRIITSTSDYYIEIEIQLDKKSTNFIFDNLKDYFLKDDSGVKWDFEKLKHFGDDIINLKIKNVEINEWYKNTTEVVKSIKLQ